MLRYEKIFEKVIPTIRLINHILNDLFYIESIAIVSKRRLDKTLAILDKIIDWFDFFEKNDYFEDQLLLIVGKILTKGINLVQKFNLYDIYKLNLKNIVAFVHTLDEEFDGEFQISGNFPNTSLEFNKINKGFNEFKIIFNEATLNHVLNYIALNDSLLISNKKLGRDYFNFFAVFFEEKNENNQYLKIHKVESKIYIKENHQRKFKINELNKHNLNCENFYKNTIKSRYHSCETVDNDGNLFVKFLVTEGRGYALSYVS